MPDKNICFLLKTLRKNKGLSQAEFAKNIGIGQSTYSEIESGKRDLPEPVLIAIESRYNVNGEWIKTGAGDMCVSKAEFPMHVNDVESPRYNWGPQFNERQQAALDKIRDISPALAEVLRRYESLDQAGRLIFEGKAFDIMEEVEREREAKRKRDSES